jgi:hypothetical protein
VDASLDPPFSIHFRALFGGQQSTVKDDIRLYTMMSHESHSMHCIFDISVQIQR